MGANFELQLISKIVAEGNLREVVALGINADKFRVLDAQMLFHFIVNYHQHPDTRNLVPDFNIIENVFPTIDLPPPSKRATIRALCKEVKDNWLKIKLEEVCSSAMENQNDPQKALATLIQDSKMLHGSAERNDDVNFADSGGDAMREYHQAKNGNGFNGIPYPSGWGYHTREGYPKLRKDGSQIHPLNEETRGINRKELVLIYGRPKNFKTWYLVDIAAEAYYMMRYRVLFLTKEMDENLIRRRIWARILELPYSPFKNGRLDPEQEKDLAILAEDLLEFERSSKRSGANPALIITRGGGYTAAEEINTLQAKIEKYEPDLVLADSVYHMKSLNSSNDLREMEVVTRGLKGVAAETGVPVVATTQANRKGEETRGSTLSEIAFSDTFGQICDLAIRIITTEDQQGGQISNCIISGAREIKLVGWQLAVEPAKPLKLKRMFESVRQVEAVFRAERQMMDNETKDAQRKLQLKQVDQEPPR